MLIGYGGAVETRSSIDEIVEALRSELDVSLIERNLALSPTERLEKMRRFQEFIETMRAARRGDRVPENH